MLIASLIISKEFKLNNISLLRTKSLKYTTHIDPLSFSLNQEQVNAFTKVRIKIQSLFRQEAAQSAGIVEYSDCISAEG